jgi:hypothetical protein
VSRPLLPSPRGERRATRVKSKVKSNQLSERTVRKEEDRRV